jgi:molybdopterin/thiamine biosynthesis adenylyltransferase
VERRVSGPDDIAALLPGADLVLSAIDRPDEVQTWVNQACVAAGVPFITGGMYVARGIYYSVDPGRSGLPGVSPDGATARPRRGSTA